MLLSIWIFVSLLPCVLGSGFVNVGSDGAIISLADQFEASNDRIFVSIAAFMDPELMPTIENLLQKAKWPHKLDFGILIQVREAIE